MKTPFVLITTLALAVSLPAMGGDFRARGRVLKVQPIYEVVQVRRPTQKCWDEDVPNRHPGAAVPVIAGAILGGVAGHQLGEGRGKDAMTAAGALLGGAIARDATRSAEGYHVERRCKTTNRHEKRREVVGYRVQYAYRGQTFWTRTKYDPGNYIDLSVDVRPIRH